VGLALLLAAGARPAAARALDVKAWDGFLQSYTKETSDVAGVRVDYAGLAADPGWRAFVAGLAAAQPGPGRDAALAFWIDVYNVLAIDMVVRHYPVESIRDIGSLFRPVWKREAGRVEGRAVTLDEIEHRILRPMGDPRIHGAIVCASTSCPPLPREAFRGERVDAQLDAAVRTWLASPDKGLRVEAGRVRVSKIFDWFAGDFQRAGGVLAFVRPFLAQPVRRALDRLGPDPPIVYFDYDWTLNDLRVENR
jgi:hypothetical protein